MSIKRIREDGHLSQEEYNRQNQLQDSSSRPLFGGSVPFTRADANVLSSRRILTVSKRGRNEEFARHLKALNSSFLKWFKEELKNKSCVDLSVGSQDYVDYIAQLEDRYLKTYGEVLTFGSGDCGQLAHGNEEDDLLVKYPRVVYSLRDKKVCGIACGGLHNAVFTETGQVYTWGCNDDASLGRVGDETTPMIVEDLSNETIIGVSCGDGQTMALSVSGDVFGWGCFKDKEGNKWFNPDSTTNPTASIRRQASSPVKILGLSAIVEILCGTCHSLARTASGEVYSWGIGECGQLGREVIKLKKDSSQDYLTKVYEQHIRPGPMFIKDSKNEVQKVTNAKVIGVGSYHSMIVTLGNSVYSCGLNNYSQLGHSDKTSSDFLLEIESLTNLGVIQAEGGMHHSLVLTSSGKMLAFGRSDYCQLGVPSSGQSAGDSSMIPVEPVMPAGTRVTQISCGGNHNLALTDTNTVYSWGYGDMLALGHGKDDDEPVPRKLDFSKAHIAQISVTQVAGGGQHSAIIGKVTKM